MSTQAGLNGVDRQRTVRIAHVLTLAVASVAALSGCTDALDGERQSDISVRVAAVGTALPAYATLLAPRGATNLDVGSSQPLSLDVGSLSSPSNPDGSPNTAVPTSLSLSSDLSRELVPAPPDAPGQPPTANYKARMWADYVANFKKYKVSIDLTENQGGGAQGHAENENLGEFTVPNALSAWMGPTPTGIYRNYDSDFAQITGA